MAYKDDDEQESEDLKESTISDETQKEQEFQESVQISESDLQTIEAPELEELQEVNREKKPIFLPTLKELFENSQLKQAEIARSLNIPRTAVSASVRTADMIYEFLENYPKHHS